MDFKTYLKANEQELDSFLVKFRYIHILHYLNKKTVNMSLTKLEKLVVMAKYLKEYPIVNQKAFDEMLNNDSLKKYKKVADLYKGNDFVEQLREFGGVYVAELIENQRKSNKEIQK